MELFKYNINEKKYGINPEEVAEMEVEEQIKFVLDKIKSYMEEKEAAKKEYDQKRAEALGAAKHYRVMRGKAKGARDIASTEYQTLRKKFNEQIDLINYKAEKYGK